MTYLRSEQQIATVSLRLLTVASFLTLSLFSFPQAFIQLFSFQFLFFTFSERERTPISSFSLPLSLSHSLTLSLLGSFEKTLLLRSRSVSVRAYPDLVYPAVLCCRRRCCLFCCPRLGLSLSLSFNFGRCRCVRHLLKNSKAAAAAAA